MVKNEDIFIEPAIRSVAELVDRILICDTGSNDNTLSIIKFLKAQYSNIEYFERKCFDTRDVGQIRQIMIDQTNEDWILVLDGDEVWYKNQLARLIQNVNQHQSKYIAYAVRYQNFIHSLDYVLDESMEQYVVKGKRGSHSVKLLRNTKTLKSVGNFGVEGYHLDGIPVQNHPETELFIDSISFCHMSFMRRSSSLTAYLASMYRFRKLFTKSKFHERDFQLPETFLIPSNCLMTGYFKINYISYIFNYSLILLSKLTRKR